MTASPRRPDVGLGFRRVLVANRGEIARRIFRTAHEMGLSTVAVYADPDASSPHVADADVAVRLPGCTSAETYLHQGALVEACRTAGADAVHPGYGFLSENAGFAAAVIAAGIQWIGPAPAVISAMGDKVAAKAAAVEAGVPTLPSAALEGDDATAWSGALETAGLGWPVLVKAAAGGGGRGMRVVQTPADLATAVESARREAAASFGDGTVFAERYLPAPRHIEIQVLADRHGTAVHLGERECSIQRRHQKIVEEAPSVAVSAELRDTMGAASVALTRAIAYEGVGTVEFLLDDATGEFFFLEMNTRLQVEHPVTEEITGLDLVRAQFEAAAGRPLGLTQADVHFAGHAIEVRLYAEDPASDWLPSPGRIVTWAPGPTPAIRWESGVESGSEVSVAFDPMLAKVVAHASTRSEAAARLSRALRELRCEGITTNAGYLADIMEAPDFLAGRTATDFVDRHPPPPPALAPAAHTAAAMAAIAAAQVSASPWPFAPAGWRNVPTAGSSVELVVDGEPCEVTDAGFEAAPLGDGRWRVTDTETGGSVDCTVTGVDGTWYIASTLGHTVVVQPERFPSAGGAAGGSSAGAVAPVPGRVISVEVAAGDAVDVGATLVVLEAMKVEHRITAPTATMVAEVLVAVGDSVDAHQLLVRLE